MNRSHSRDSHKGDNHRHQHGVIDPELVEEIRHVAGHVKEVLEVSGVRARWIGHRLYAEINLAVDPDLSVAEAHEISLNAGMKSCIECLFCPMS